MNILHVDGNILYDAVGATSIREALEQAVKASANLSGANLHGANLSGVNLSGVTGVDPNRCTPLRILYEQPGLIRAYKLTDASGGSPIHSTGRIVYALGESYEALDACEDENEQCAAGINVATLNWCMRNYQHGWRIFVVEFTASDIAAIPVATDGKFRLFRCRVVAELDLVALGLEQIPENVAEVRA